MMGRAELKPVKVLGMSFNKWSFSFILSSQPLSYWHWGSPGVSQVPDTPRDSGLEFRTLGLCEPSLPCAGWVMCHTELCGCKHQKLILADVSEVDILQRSWKVTEWAECWQNMKTGRNQDAELSAVGDGVSGTILEHKWCGQVCLVLRVSAESIWRHAWVTHFALWKADEPPGTHLDW